MDILQGYQIHERLASGGMAFVYRATQISLNREVALKVIQPGILPGAMALQRFQREMQLASRLHHPNLVRVFDGGSINGTPYIAMELVPGGDLQRLLERDGPLAWRVAAALADCIADGLAYLHERQREWRVSLNRRPHFLEKWRSVFSRS